MYFDENGELSNVGVTTVGITSALDWPSASSASDMVCCKTSHLSDFVVTQGLYITDYSPARNAVNVSKDTNITLTFSTPIAIGTGTCCCWMLGALTGGCTQVCLALLQQMVKAQMLSDTLMSQMRRVYHLLRSTARVLWNLTLV